MFGAETGFRLERDPDTVLAPDVAFVAAARLPRNGIPRGYPELVPDLVVEVTSPDDSASEVKAKVAAWLEYGTREAWVADPDARTLVIHGAEGRTISLTHDDKLAESEVLPALRLPARDCFA